LVGIQDLQVYGKSFLPQVHSNIAKQQSHRCTVSVQPFGGKKIAIIEYPLKRVYDIAQQQVLSYDLEADSGENVPMKIDKIDSPELDKLEECLKSLPGHS
jgi:hypothetical protein